jgi:hypothetical protein
MSHSCPSGVPSILPLLGVTEALEEALKRETGGEMVDTRENGGTDDFNDALPLGRQPLL